jgi:hypothetical protein
MAAPSASMRNVDHPVGRAAVLVLVIGQIERANQLARPAARAVILHHVAGFLQNLRNVGYFMRTIDGWLRKCLSAALNG